MIRLLLFLLVCVFQMCFLLLYLFFFFFKQKTAYEMRISDWSSDVCSSDLLVMPASLRKRDDCHDTARRYLHSFARDLQSLVCLQIGRASCRERVCQYV